MDKKQTTCPNCGASFDIINVSNMECPYCGGILKHQVTEQANNSNLYEVDALIPFGISEEEAKQKLVWELANCNKVPLKIFESLNIRAQKVYYPVWLFSGKIEVQWSCTKIIKHKNYHPFDNPDAIDYVPIQGVELGHYSMGISATSRDIHQTTPTISICKNRDETSIYIIEQDAIVYKKDISSHLAWNSDAAKSTIKDHADRIVERKLPKEYEDVNGIIHYLDSNEECRLEARWLLTYEYDGKEYECFCDGSNGTIINFQHPSETDDENAETTYIQNEVNNPISLSVFERICFAIFLIAFLYLWYSFNHSTPKSSAWISFVLLVLSAVFPFDMLLKQSKEDNLISVCKSYYEKSIIGIKIKERYSSLLSNSNSLLNPYRENMEKEIKKIELNDDIAHFKQAVDTYNTQLKKHKSIMSVYYIILFVLLILIPISHGYCTWKKNKNEKSNNYNVIYIGENKTIKKNPYVLTIMW